MDKELEQFIKTLSIENIDYDLLKKALTHSSYTKANNLDRTNSYERLEFLGDAVLKLVSSKLLYEKYPKYTEGEMTKVRSYLISDKTLSEFALKLGFQNVIILSEAEDKAGGRLKPMILACAFESLLGAIFLTYGLEFCTNYLNKIYLDKITELVKNINELNPKANLQEFLQKQGKALPEYKIINESGPQHDKTFECEILIEGKSYATACANTKKDAEALAAQKAFQIMEKECE